MKRISYYAKGNRTGNLLHIETDGCIVNIQVGLHDVDGRQVTSVRILPDDESRGGDGQGRIWHVDGSRVIRLHEDEGREAYRQEHTPNSEPDVYDPEGGNGFGVPLNPHALRPQDPPARGLFPKTEKTEREIADELGG